MLAVFVILSQRAAAESSLLSDAGNWAAILAAAILISGLVFGWFRQVSHSLHISSEKVLIGADDDGVYFVPSVDLLNTAGIPLGYEVTRFTVVIGNRPSASVLDDEGRLYIAPQQQTDWAGERQRLEAWEFIEGHIRIEARYGVQYGRKSPRLWWWRREIRGGYVIDLPTTSAEAMTLLAVPLDGPRTDMRVPWTSKTILGWRL